MANLEDQELARQNKAIEDRLRSELAGATGDRVAEELPFSRQLHEKEAEIRTKQARIAQLQDPNLDDAVKANILAIEGFSEGENYNFVADKIREDLMGLEGQISGLGESVRQERLTRLRQKEKSLGDEAIARQLQLNELIDKRLQEALAETGYNANIARSQIGAAFAGRGLGRSSFATEGIGGATLAEQQQKAQARGQATAMKQQQTEQLAGQFGQIRRARERAEIQRDLASIQAAEDITFNIDMADMQEQFKRRLVDLEFSQQESDIWAGIIGAAVGGVGGAFVGGAPGAAIGGSAGYQLGTAAGEAF